MLTLKQILHTLRNPYGHTREARREAAIAAADRIDALTKGEKESAVAPDANKAWICTRCRTPNASYYLYCRACSQRR